MSNYKYSTAWYQHRRIIANIAVIVIAFILLVAGGLLLGFKEALQPFDALPLAIVLLVFGGIVVIASLIFLIIQLSFYAESY